MKNPLFKGTHVIVNKKHHKIVQKDLWNKGINFSQWVRTKEQEYIEEHCDEK